jgi:hypothetical protein
MITPYRIAQIQVAWIGGRADNAAGNRTSGGAKAGISRRRANHCTACSAY